MSCDNGANYSVVKQCVSVPKCMDPNASNYNQPGACVYTASFGMSVAPNRVNARSLAGYSGALEKELQISINPVSGFTAPVVVKVDQTSLPAGILPEFSFGGGAYSTDPSALMTLSGGYHRYNGLVYLPVMIRFKGKLDQTKAYTIKFTGTGLAGGNGAGKTASASVIIDSHQLNPEFREI